MLDFFYLKTSHHVQERPPKEEQSEAWKIIEAIEDETHPTKRAIALKDNGNNCYKAGKKRWKDALDFYEQALDVKCGDDRLESQVLSNRALIHLKKGNYGTAIEDCKSAIAKHPWNSKAYCRAGQASQSLGKMKEAMRWYEHALKKAGDDFLKRNFVRNLIKKLDIIIEKEAEAKREAKMKRAMKNKAHEMIREAVKLREIKCTRATFSGEHQPKLDTKGGIHWPVLFMYPEFLQTDFVQDFHELRTFKEQLAQMFPPKTPPAPWDQKMNYVLLELDVYIEIKSSTPHTVRRVGMDEPLAEALVMKDVVLEGVPTFMVVSRKSKYMENFQGTHNVLK